MGVKFGGPPNCPLYYPIPSWALTEVKDIGIPLRLAKLCPFANCHRGHFVSRWQALAEFTRHSVLASGSITRDTCKRTLKGKRVGLIICHRKATRKMTQIKIIESWLQFLPHPLRSPVSYFLVCNLVTLLTIISPTEKSLRSTQKGYLAKTSNAPVLLTCKV